MNRLNSLVRIKRIAINVMVGKNLTFTLIFIKPDYVEITIVKGNNRTAAIITIRRIRE